MGGDGTTLITLYRAGKKTNLFIFMKGSIVNREIKRDVTCSYVKRQTAKMKLLRLSLAL